MTRLISFFERLSGKREEFWIRNGNTISVCACLSTKTKKVSRNGKGTKMAQRALQEAERLAQNAGSIKSKGVLMRGNSDMVTAIGMVDIDWSPDSEKALEGCGVAEVK